MKKTEITCDHCNVRISPDFIGSPHYQLSQQRADTRQGDRRLDANIHMAFMETLHYCCLDCLKAGVLALGVHA